MFTFIGEACTVHEIRPEYPASAHTVESNRVHAVVEPSLQQRPSFRHIYAALVTGMIMVNNHHIHYLLASEPLIGRGRLWLHMLWFPVFPCGHLCSASTPPPSIFRQYSVHPGNPPSILNPSPSIILHPSSIQHPSILHQTSIHPPCILHLSSTSILRPFSIRSSSIHPPSIFNIDPQYTSTISSSISSVHPISSNPLPITTTL